MNAKRMTAREEFTLSGERSRLSRASHGTRTQRHNALNRADGTRQLLVSGFSTLAVGFAAGLLAATVFGGVDRQGAHSNAGWLALIVAMMSTPFALLLLSLGAAKWLRNLRLSRLPSAR